MDKFAEKKIYDDLNDKLDELKMRESLFDLALYKSIDKNYTDFGNIPTIYLLVSNAILSFVLEFWLFKEGKADKKGKADKVINIKYIIEAYAFNDSSVDIFKEFSDSCVWENCVQSEQISIKIEEHKGANNVLIVNKSLIENDDKYVDEICEVVKCIIDFMGEKVKKSKEYKNYDLKKCIKGELFKDSLLFCEGQVQESFYEELKAKSESTDKPKDPFIKRLLSYNNHLFTEWNEEEFIKALNLFILDDRKPCTEIIESAKRCGNNCNINYRLNENNNGNKMDIQKLNRLLLEVLYSDKVTKRYDCCLNCSIVNECKAR